MALWSQLLFRCSPAGLRRGGAPHPYCASSGPATPSSSSDYGKVDRGSSRIVPSRFRYEAPDDAMILPQTYIQLLILMIVSLICLGSWGLTYKATQRWRFELYYLDFAIGAVLVSI